MIDNYLVLEVSEYDYLCLLGAAQKTKIDSGGIRSHRLLILGQIFCFRIASSIPNWPDLLCSFKDFRLIVFFVAIFCLIG